MNNKELLEILSCIDTAKRLTKKMCEQSKNLAEEIATHMQDLGVSDLMGGKYRLKTVRANVGSSTGLVRVVYQPVECYDLLVSLDTSSISPERDTCYLYGDFNATYNLPSRSDVLEFLRDVKALLIELADTSKLEAATNE